MADETRINPNIANGNVTRINNAINNDQPSGGGATVLNPQLGVQDSITEGTCLCGKYIVSSKMNVTTGEADLYRCKCDGIDYVAKVYRRSVAIKAEVLARLKTINSPYVARLIETGKYGGATVEILPYYRRGSLKGRTLNYLQIKKIVLPCLNEALRCLHNANIIHKDIKPSNIMLFDDAKGVAIIDFGISSMTENDHTVVVTRTGMTPEYSAPETFKGLFLSQSDYYSLGITLYELFYGKTPYGNMSPEEIDRYVSIQQIPFEHDAASEKPMPTDLKDLIKALTYHDISNRRDLSNPNRRWGYEEVKKWLAGVKQTLPGEARGPKQSKAFAFCGKNYTDKLELIRALTQNWIEGKKQLFRGQLSRYYNNYDNTAFQICQRAEVEATRSSGKDDLIFWKAMNALEPQNKDFFWKGRQYAGLPALGRDLLEQLRKGNSSMADFMDSLYKEGIMSLYVEMKDENNKKLIEAIKALESKYRACGNNDYRQKRVTQFLTAYMLSGQKVFYTAGQEFHNVDELVFYMKKLLGPNHENIEQFKEFCHGLMDHYKELIPAFESWLIALGKQKEIEAWRTSMEESD